MRSHLAQVAVVMLNEKRDIGWFMADDSRVILEEPREDLALLSRSRGLKVQYLSLRDPNASSISQLLPQ
ncbi:uncharacterized protein RCO7_14999 [Rhynchosporium graminicola]|uniref:Uncharacterized protein n=1 Tax=Rhynchosporium graminicola TaxID=2792576 RepID=A0A1E1LGX8_9HELO|nr:uncharacterized protein RCO7_14999 [Rhynchosporium commune]